jgi:phospholipid/cholesterol/gamma-HCH transport system substrate-binding protein
MAKSTNNIKLGLFTFTGAALLILCLYLIGAKGNLFSKTITINGIFKNAEGLMSGNNVRFAGINVGTVKEVSILNDTTVSVKMIIERDAQKFIRIGSLTTIGSDGLMGNKLVNINTPLESVNSKVIEEGDTLYSLKSVGTDEMLRTLSSTNTNINDITNDIKVLSNKLRDNSSVLNLLSDSSLVLTIKASLANLESTTKNANAFSANLDVMVANMKAGEGVAGKLTSDKKSADEFETLLQNLKDASDSAKLTLHHMHQFMRDLNLTPGPLGVLARDTVMGNDLRITMHNLKLSSISLNENMIAMRRNFLFRKYFKEQEKELEKAKKDSVGN